jgi:hypothetical protein
MPNPNIEQWSVSDRLGDSTAGGRSVADLVSTFQELTALGAGFVSDRGVGSNHPGGMVHGGAAPRVRAV